VPRTSTCRQQPKMSLFTNPASPAPFTGPLVTNGPRWGPSPDLRREVVHPPLSAWLKVRIFDEDPLASTAAVRFQYSSESGALSDLVDHRKASWIPCIPGAWEQSLVLNLHHQVDAYQVEQESNIKNNRGTTLRQPTSRFEREARFGHFGQTLPPAPEGTTVPRSTREGSVPRSRTSPAGGREDGSTHVRMPSKRNAAVSRGRGNPSTKEKCEKGQGTSTKGKTSTGWGSSNWSVASAAACSSWWVREGY
jgi:hypothetical protein